MLSIAVFGQGESPVFLDQVDCIGTEERLLDCSHGGIGHHFRAAECELDIIISCKGVQLRSYKINNYCNFCILFCPQRSVRMER